MSIQRNYWSITESVTDHEVSDSSHSVGANQLAGDSMFLDPEAETFEKLGSALGMSSTVARRVVGRHLDQLSEEAHLLIEPLVD
jgi:hypothetical protein